MPYITDTGNHGIVYVLVPCLTSFYNTFFSVWYCALSDCDTRNHAAYNGNGQAGQHEMGLLIRYVGRFKMSLHFSGKLVEFNEISITFYLKGYLNLYLDALLMCKRKFIFFDVKKLKSCLHYRFLERALLKIAQ